MTLPILRAEPPPIPEPSPEVEELRREVRRLKRRVEDDEPPKQKSSAIGWLLGIAFVLMIICCGVASRVPKGGGGGRPDDVPQLYGMSAKDALQRYGQPTLIEDGEQVGAFVYRAAGVKLVISRGRVIRFDDLGGNKMNAFDADRRLRGVE